MKKLGIIFTLIMLLTFILGTSACNNGEGKQQPTATPPATPVGDIGKTKQDGGLKVTFKEAYAYDLCFIAGNYCDISVNLNVENTGETTLQNFTCSLKDAQNTQDSIEILYSGLIPTGKRENVYFVFGDRDTPQMFVKDSELRLVIMAEDPTKNSYMVQFVLPPINELTVKGN